MALLDNNNVIFYHPLDTFDDTYLDVDWMGSGGFPSGKIENAFSPVTTDALSFGAVSDLAGTGVSRALCGHHCISIIDETRFLTLYYISYNDSTNFGVRAKVTTVTSSGIEFGSEFDIDRTADFDTVDALALAKIDNGEKFIGIWSTTTGAIRGMVISTSGTTVTSGVLTTISTLGTPQTPDVVAIDDTRALASWSFFAGASPNRRAKTCVLEASGNTLTIGSIVDVYSETDTGFPYTTISKIDTDKMAVVWAEPELNIVRATVVNVSGLVATPSTPTTIMANGAKAGRGSLVANTFNPSNLLITSTKLNSFPANDRGPYATLCSVSGNVISSGTTLFWSGDTGLPALGSVLINPSSVLLHRGKLADPVTETRRVNFNGSTISFGDIAATNLSASFNSTSVCVDAINDNLAIVGAGFSDVTIKVHTGMVNRTGEISAVSGTLYPSTSGHDRLVYAFWSRELLRNSSLVEIIRDYDLFLNNTAFSLGVSGTSGAIWNNNGITDIISILNNSDDNFLVLDFSYQGSGNWNLLTSLNGSGFVNQGIQNSGTQNLIVTPSAPRVKMGDGTSNMWIDELVLWAGTSGTFDSFTSDELQKLNDLADVRNLPMYYYTIDNNSIDLFIYSTVLENNSLNLFIKAIGSINDSFNLFINGKIIVNNDLDLFITSSHLSFNNKDLYIQGIIVQSDSLTLTLTYPDFVIDDINLFIKVPEPINDFIDLFILSHQSLTDQLDLFIYGKDTTNDNINCIIKGLASKNNSCNLFISSGFSFALMNLFIKGINEESDDGFGLSLDDLLRTGDFNPQIIGRFSDTVTDVTIELWIIRDGVGIPLTILSDQCYEINSTGRWSWSTKNIESLPYIVNQFVYRMTGNDATVFIGDFILRTRPKYRRVRKTVRR